MLINKDKWLLSILLKYTLLCTRLSFSSSRRFHRLSTKCCVLKRKMSVCTTIFYSLPVVKTLPPHSLRRVYCVRREPIIAWSLTLRGKFCSFQTFFPRCCGQSRPPKESLRTTFELETVVIDLRLRSISTSNWVRDDLSEPLLMSANLTVLTDHTEEPNSVPSPFRRVWSQSRIGPDFVLWHKTREWVSELIFIRNG